MAKRKRIDLAAINRELSRKKAQRVWLVFRWRRGLALPGQFCVAFLTQGAAEEAAQQYRDAFNPSRPRDEYHVVRVLVLRDNTTTITDMSHVAAKGER